MSKNTVTHAQNLTARAGTDASIALHPAFAHFTNELRKAHAEGDAYPRDDYEEEDDDAAIPGLYCPSCHGDPQGYDESLIRLDSARVSCYICNWTGNEAAAITLPDLD